MALILPLPVIVHPPIVFAIHGTWIPAIPVGMTKWGLNDYGEPISTDLR